jgi:hypothetical protein
MTGLDEANFGRFEPSYDGASRDDDDDDDDDDRSDRSDDDDDDDDESSSIHINYPANVWRPDTQVVNSRSEFVVSRRVNDVCDVNCAVLCAPSVVQKNIRASFCCNFKSKLLFI